MDCPNCGHPNPSGARFCGSCATPLTGAFPCPSCGASNPAGQRFCNACGEELSAAVGEAAPTAALSSSPQALQNLWPAGFEAPQLGHGNAPVSGVAQLPQNRAPDGLG